MDCKECEKNYTKPVSYIAYESMQYSMERTIRRLWILAIVLTVFLVATNALWLCYESRWKVVDTSEVTQEVDIGDGNAFVAGIGDVNYGESAANN